MDEKCIGDKKFLQFCFKYTKANRALKNFNTKMKEKERKAEEKGS